MTDSMQMGLFSLNQKVQMVTVLTTNWKQKSVMGNTVKCDKQCQGGDSLTLSALMVVLSRINAKKRLLIDQQSLLSLLSYQTQQLMGPLVSWQW